MNPRKIKHLDRELRSLQVQIKTANELDYLQRAEIARKAQSLVHEAAAFSRSHPRDLRAREIHASLVELFRETVAQACPPAFRQPDPGWGLTSAAGLESAVSYLEADPWYFRSGYLKAELIRKIRRLELPPGLADRLLHVVLAAVDMRDRREFREYCRLARKLDSPELRGELSSRLRHEDPAVRRRARWALDACEKPR